MKRSRQTVQSPNAREGSSLNLRSDVHVDSLPPNSSPAGETTTEVPRRSVGAFSPSSRSEDVHDR